MKFKTHSSITLLTFSTNPNSRLRRQILGIGMKVHNCILYILLYIIINLIKNTCTFTLLEVEKQPFKKICSRFEDSVCFLNITYLRCSRFSFAVKT